MKFVVEPKTSKDIALLAYAGASVMVLSTPFFSANVLEPAAEEALPELIEECHRFQTEAFVDVTRMFVDSEMERLKQFLSDLKSWGADGIYFADMGVYEMACELGMDALCIFQPDTLITSSPDASLYLSLGMKAVSVARELTLAEVCEIAKENPGKTEVMIHGYPLMTVSKRPLISNYFDEIGYQGERKSFYHLVEEKRDARMPIFEDAQGTHMFGGYCLVSFQEIQALAQAGVMYARLQSNFLDTTDIVYALKGYREVLNKQKTPDMVLEETRQRHPEIPFGAGFYYTKTEARKEDLTV